MAHFATATSIEANEGVDAALGEYQQALELDPKNVTLALRLANIHLARRRLRKPSRSRDNRQGQSERCRRVALAGHSAPVERSVDESDGCVSADTQDRSSQLGATRALVDSLLQKNQTQRRPSAANAFRHVPMTRGTGMARPHFTEALKQNRSEPHVSPKLRSNVTRKPRTGGNDPDILLLLADAMPTTTYIKAAEAYEQLLPFGLT